MMCPNPYRRSADIAAQGNGQAPPPPTNGDAPPRPAGEGEGAARPTSDQARELKKLAQTAFGFAAGERRLRHDLGFEPDERLTLRHLCAHVTVAQYAALMTAYEATLRQEVEADVP
jgi:hypothetical protein